MPVAKTPGFLPVRIERQHVGAIGLAAPSLRRGGAGRSRTAILPAVPASLPRHCFPKPTETSMRLSPGVKAISRVEWPKPLRQLRDHGFMLLRGLEVAGIVGEADNAVGFGDVNPLRIAAARKEGDAERLVKSAGIDFVCRRPWVSVGRAQDTNSSGRGFRDEDVPVGRHAHLARSAQSVGEQLDLEPRRDLRKLGRRPAHDVGNIGGGRGSLRVSANLRAGSAALRPALSGVPVTERGGARQRLRLGERGSNKSRGGDKRPDETVSLVHHRTINMK